MEKSEKARLVIDKIPDIIKEFLDRTSPKETSESEAIHPVNGSTLQTIWRYSSHLLQKSTTPLLNTSQTLKSAFVQREYAQVATPVS